MEEIAAAVCTPRSVNVKDVFGEIDKTHQPISIQCGGYLLYVYKMGDIFQMKVVLDKDRFPCVRDMCIMFYKLQLGHYKYDMYPPSLRITFWFDAKTVANEAFKDDIEEGTKNTNFCLPTTSTCPPECHNLKISSRLCPVDKNPHLLLLSLGATICVQ
jgi:hypothetical protein